MGTEVYAMMAAALPPLRRRRLLGALLLPLALSGIIQAGGCRRKTEGDSGSGKPTGTGAAGFAGSYAIRPSAGESVLMLHPDGSATLSSGGNQWRGAYQVTTQSLRVFITPERTGPSRLAPIGVFLVADYSASGWRGIWDGDVAFLVRAGAGSGPANQPPEGGRAREPPEAKQPPKAP